MRVLALLARAYFDLSVHGRFFAVVLFVLVGVHADVVEGELVLDPVFEQLPLLQRQAIRLRNHGNDIHGLAQLLQHDDVNRLQRVSSWCDEVEAAMDAGILNVSLALRRELLAQVCGVLVLDVLDDWVPAAVIVHQVAIARGVDDV